MTQMTMEQAHEEATKLITKHGENIAAHINMWSSDSASKRRIFDITLRALQGELVEKILCSKSSIAQPDTSFEELVMATARDIVDYIQAVSTQQQTQLDVLREVFVGIQESAIEALHA